MSNQPQLTFAGMVRADATERCELHDDDCETCDSTCPSYCGAPAKYALVTRWDGREVRTAFCEGHLGGMVALSEGMRAAQDDPADRIDDAEALAWYRATFDDDGTSDDLALIRMRAWARGQSVGPFAQGVPLRSENYDPAPF